MSLERKKIVIVYIYKSSKKIYNYEQSKKALYNI